MSGPQRSEHELLLLLIKLLKLIGVAFAAAVIYVFAQSYAGRVALVDAERHGCTAGMVDRFDDLESWYAAYHRAWATAERLREPGLALLHENGAGAAGSSAIGPDVRAALSYMASLRDKLRRVDARHSLTWPDPRVSAGPYAHPLGLGHFSCPRQYPGPSPLP